MGQGSALRATLTIVCLIFFGLVAGLAGSMMTAHLGTSSYTISYSDFITILLSAISLLMTLLAIIIAVLGFVGWATISSGVKGSIETFLSDGFKEGNHLAKMLEKKIEEARYGGVQPIGPVDEDEDSEYSEDVKDG